MSLFGGFLGAACGLIAGTFLIWIAMFTPFLSHSAQQWSFHERVIDALKGGFFLSIFVFPIGLIVGFIVGMILACACYLFIMKKTMHIPENILKRIFGKTVFFFTLIPLIISIAHGRAFIDLTLNSGAILIFPIVGFCFAYLKLRNIYPELKIQKSVGEKP
ncbi:MAG: hypothetical protein L6Q57_00960 [Alphaproteobacteria bacterium]|nr:hypothetical protein [Alphaproteobacteria bacterium]